MRPASQVCLTPVDAACRDTLLRLQVTEAQAAFVTGVAVALEEAAAMPECAPRAVGTADGAVVGFLMYALDRNERQPWIYRILIDRRHQGRGFGRAALVAAVNEIAESWPLQPRVYLGVRPENRGAVAFYGRCGFQPDGRVIGGETVLWRPVSGAC